MSDKKDKIDAPEPTLEDFLGQLFDGGEAQEAVEPVAQNQLAVKLRQRIERQGPLTLHDYMQACLSDPEYGYYLVRDPFGAGGDFVTAPDICQIFGELLGLWCVHVWAELGQPKGCKLIELGPGRGSLMSDALRAASLVPEFLHSVEVHFVETSQALQRVQEDHIRSEAADHERILPDLFWHEKLADVPDGPSLLIANEFLDALPIRQFQFTGGRWFERMVALDEAGGFVYALDDKPLDGLEALPPIHRRAIEGDFLETCPASAELVEHLALRAANHAFAGLLIDYGYSEPALGDTFQAIKSHEFTDPLREPGLADVTAHVNFSQLLKTADEHGLTSAGPTTQRDFLVSLGLRERAAQLMEGQENMMAAHAFVTGFQRLIEPDQMGHLFKAVALTGADQPLVPGFETPAGSTNDPKPNGCGGEQSQ